MVFKPDLPILTENKVYIDNEGFGLDVGPTLTEMSLILRLNGWLARTV